MEMCTDYRQRDSQGKKIYPVTKQSQRNRIALLISNLKFNVGSNTRGAEKDEQVMYSLLQTMGYEVVRRSDLTAQTICPALEEFSEHPKLTLTDSVFVAVLSYGSVGTKCATDTEEFEIDTIFQNLNTTKCPALKDKPKIIIIQDCRGVEDSIRSPSVNFAKHARVQKEKDFIIFYSSTLHTVSHEHTTYGSRAPR
ncbi:caspase-1-like [Archocentrus centrarchus]|uniref:caspase-1-like n=1 Tax=Archocentrus centrarchus TaxID=63155 RepID=UPI0011EA37BD|nr:caspase-1-like [Archocentrus centrarchus]